MSEKEYRTPRAEDEDLSPSFTRNRRAIPQRGVSQRDEKTGETVPRLISSHPSASSENARKEPRMERKVKASAVGTVEEREEDVEPLTDERLPQKKREGSLRAKRIFSLVAAVLLVIAVGCLAGNLLFSVRDITVVHVDGAIGWTESAVIEAAGIRVGDSMRSVKAKEISERISEKFSALAGADVSKVFPGKVIIIPHQATPTYRFSHDGVSYILSKELKVLAQDDGSHESLPELFVAGILDCSPGNRLTFSVPRDYSVTCEIAAMIVDRMGEMSIDRIDIRNKFSIEVICKSKYKLLFGDKSNLEQKIKLVKETLGDPVFSGGAPAVVDVSGGNKASVKFTEIGK